MELFNDCKVITIVFAIVIIWHSPWIDMHCCIYSRFCIMYCKEQMWNIGASSESVNIFGNEVVENIVNLEYLGISDSSCH